jgi:tetratricopeptide (TPR) repeat protein
MSAGRRDGNTDGSRRRTPAFTRPAREEVAGEPAAMAAAAWLWIALALLAAARAALTFSHGMWMWGLNVQRFLDPLLGWLPWLITALALVPPLARRVEPAVARAGRALATRNAALHVALALFVVGLVWGNADNTRFVGDFLLRQGTVEINAQPAVLFPQALPLDVFLHYTFPNALQTAQIASANTTARVLGVIDAVALALIATTFVRALSLTGAAAFAAWSVAVFGGTLAMFTGYSKALAELVVVAAAIGTYGLRLALDGKSKIALGITLALGFLLHRSAVVFLIPATVAWAIALRREGRAAGRARATWIGLGIPLGTLALIAPRIVRTMLRFDAVHLAPYEVRHQGVIAAAFGGHRALDLLNLALMLSPLAIAAPFLFARLGRPFQRSREAALLAALALPLVLVAPFVHPAQGLFRDWDDFAATGSALSLVTAWCVGETLRGAGARRWLAVPVSALVVLLTFQWLAHSNQVDLGFQRVKAFVTEPPPRTDIERAGTWDYLGVWNYRLDRYTEAAAAFSQATIVEPSPRLYQQWALAATMTGDYRSALAVYQKLVVIDPKNASAWAGYGAVASRIPDVDSAFLGAHRCLALDPGNSVGRPLLAYLRRTYPGRDTAFADTPRGTR